MAVRTDVQLDSSFDDAVVELGESGCRLEVVDRCRRSPSDLAGLIIR